MLANTTLPSASQVTIRAYRPEDWRAVCAVHDRARPLELRNSCDPKAFVPLANDHEEADDFHRSQKFVACFEDTVIGFVGIDQHCISWLYVDPKYARRGIGRRLLRSAIHRIGAQAWTIVLSGNTPARCLYESEGFQVVDAFESMNAGYSCTCLELALKE
ncbi:GNAT family N-acetyltransferase [Oscillatoria sp. CS-180]|uniref:GNAT family N-acetyltransferase n=1 Tax=Oscillatoria sp. CS-180 TaxID=3021720 RepID=UPI00232FBFFC|nr:GNAT family N-acetyltransferase [Oscillatoria sp. CS-180]MDB9524904.1 GNAT family N-acetyltransferase [Oscillatoria sp. CS-180]